MKRPVGGFSFIGNSVGASINVTEAPQWRMIVPCRGCFNSTWFQHDACFGNRILDSVPLGMVCYQCISTLACCSVYAYPGKGGKS